MRAILALVLGLAAAPLAAAQSDQPRFDPGHIHARIAGKPGELLVLGSPHLSTFPDSFAPANLAPLLARLAAWKPQAIAIEAVSGPQCDFMRAYPDRYADTVKGYCWDPAPARKATGLTVPEATREAERLLTHWPDAPTPAQRRHLAALFLASGDRASAMVQWFRLPEAERREGNGLDATLAASLAKLSTRHDESIQIAARLAARLGLERIFPIDDHTADFMPSDDAAFNDAITKAWDNPANHARQAHDKRMNERMGTPEGLLAIYRDLNAPGMGKVVFDSDFGAALRDPSPQEFGRQYVAYWETRNLRMAANIRDMLRAKPDERALVIVGASHKSYFEAYLRQMHDLSLEDAERVLK
ncbi:DUF5694 domain-containing protein [Novosphingobium beihaiensis]|uniref:DUF5694 domain-containing protein n=1 Tax=Novosphingobium beihaiensis TaxID=2930389 RepID=A0ABT0BUB7_9SPHN|nr:DUF5694 domain-containing protein [Novosphingobium beihaiensis]MCJ2188644.1 DUF5694 domain-containing protein [Novosphingobium beihaiensis]